MTLKRTLFSFLTAGILIFVTCSNVVSYTKITQNESLSSPLFTIRCRPDQYNVNNAISRQYLGENSNIPMFIYPQTIDNKMNQILSILQSGPTQKIQTFINQAISDLLNSGKIDREDIQKITIGLNDLFQHPELIKKILENSQRTTLLHLENVWLPGKFLPFIIFIVYFAIIIVYAVFYQVYQCFDPNDPNLTFYQCTLVP
ncbi:MAG: hypothetical protein KKC68_05815 [Candidatus Thermoplasmatota archaeon]|nr:hypothetical protein [Candidatus Thermoplasmatota archaeon]MBU1941273.1 hypothetical protein [Candidatus Thermoplasmatota archaeon]